MPSVEGLQPHILLPHSAPPMPQSVQAPLIIIRLLRLLRPTSGRSKTHVVDLYTVNWKYLTQLNCGLRTKFTPCNCTLQPELFWGSKGDRQLLRCAKRLCVARDVGYLRVRVASVTHSTTVSFSHRVSPLRSYLPFRNLCCCCCCCWRCYCLHAECMAIRALIMSRRPSIDRQRRMLVWGLIREESSDFPKFLSRSAL